MHPKICTRNSSRLQGVLSVNQQAAKGAHKRQERGEGKGSYLRVASIGRARELIIISGGSTCTSIDE